MFHSETIKKLPIYELLFYVFLFMLPFQTRILFHPKQAYIDWYFSYHLGFFFYLTDLILITCFISWFLFGKPDFSLKIRLNRHIFAFFGLILITLFHVKQLDLGLYSALKWLELLLLVLFVSQTIKGKWQFKAIFYIIFVSGIVQAAIGILQFHVQHSLNLGFLGEYIAPLGTAGLATIQFGAEKIIRAYGTLPHPNVLGGFLVLVLTMGYFLVSRGTTTMKWLVSCGTVLILLGIFFSFSRLAWLATILITVGFLYHYFRSNRKILIYLSLIILITATILGIGFKDLLVSRAGDLSETSQAVVARGSFDRYGIEIFQKSPLLGIGAGNYIVAMQEMFELEPWQYQPPHNIFILVAAELGILGVALFIIILVEIFMVAIKKKFEYNFVLLTLGLIFIGMSLFDHYFLTIQQGRLTFFLILGLIMAANNFSNHDEQTEKLA